MLSISCGFFEGLARAHRARQVRFHRVALTVSGKIDLMLQGYIILSTDYA